MSTTNAWGIFMTVAAIETIRLAEFPNLIWVIIEDSAGNRGLGETFFGAEAVEAYIHESAAGKLIGEPAGAIDAARIRLRPYVGHQGAGAEMRGNSAIDIALWDLLGKRTGQAVWQLLGGRCRDRIRTYNTCAGSQYVRQASGQTSSNWGIGGSDGPYEDLEAFLNDAGGLAESLLAEGITAMKIWPFDRFAEASGGMSITPQQLEQGCSPFAKIRDAVGDRMQIMLEMHSLWSLPAAVEIARAVEPYGVYWIEDPIPANGVSSLADFRAQTKIKVTASETLATRQQFRSLMEENAVDVVMLDLGWCGGLTEAKAIAGMAEAWHLPVAPHDCTGPVVWAASCHLSLNAPNALIQESVRAYYSGWYRQLVDRLPVVEHGEISLPDGPGLGLNLLPGLTGRPDAHLRRSE